jgi:lambda family phage portal protein
MIDGIRQKIKSMFIKPTAKPAIKESTEPRASIVPPTVSIGYGSGSKFPSGMSRTSSAVLLHNHFQIRQSARDMMFDSMECRALVQSQVDTIVDWGLQPKSMPVASVLGITDEEAESWADKVDEMFHLWASSKKSHRARVNNFYQNQRLYQLFQQRDNDVFVALFYGRDKDQINPLQIEFVDPNQICGAGFTSSYVNTYYDDGIVRDDKGREIGYKLWNYDPNTGKYTESTVPAYGEKSGRIFMLHGFNPEYAGQGRGYSRLAHLLQELEHLTDYKQSVLQKAINQASVIGVIENEEQDASQPLAGRVAGPRPEYGTSPDSSEDTGEAAGEDPYVNWNANPEATIRQPGSMLIGNMRRGDKWKNLQDTSPGPVFDSFCNNLFSYIAASTGSAEEVVRRKFANNFSASRGILILVWRNAVIWRMEMNVDYNDPIREMWLAEEIAAGRISCPGWSDPGMRAAWLKCEWSGSPMPNIDPLKTAEADEKYVTMGAQTLDDVARNLNGSSGKANRLKNARQFQELPPSPFSQVAPAQGQEDKDDGDDSNAQASLIPKISALVEKYGERLEEIAGERGQIENGISESISELEGRINNKITELNQGMTELKGQKPPDINIPVDVHVNVERDDKKVTAEKSIKITHDEKGRVIGAEVKETSDGN